MKKFKKSLAVAVAPLLATTMLVPAVAFSGTAQAAEMKLYAQVDYDNEMLLLKASATQPTSGDMYDYDLADEGYKKIYVSTVKNGKESAPEVYGASDKIDISSYVVKGAELKVWTDKDDKNKLTVKIPAQDKKTAVSLDSKTNLIKFEAPKGTAVDNLKIEWRTANSDWSVYAGDDGNATGVVDDAAKENGKFDAGKDTVYFRPEVYSKKGATIYVRKAASASSIKADKVEDGYPASKEAKLKIKAEAKAPTVKLDAVKGTISFPKGVQFKLTDGVRVGKTAYEDKYDWTTAYTQKETFSLEEFMAKKITTSAILVTEGALKNVNVAEADIPSNAAVLEVRTAATDRKPASKITEVKIPWQKVIVSKSAITKGSVEITYDYKDVSYRDGKTKVTVKNAETKGLTIKNATSGSIQYAIVDSDDASKIDAKAWKTLKTAKSKAFKTTKLADGKYIAVRVAGVNDVKSTKDKNEFTWASNVVFADKVAYPKKIENSLSVSWGEKTSALTASGAAVTVGPKDGATYYYEVADKEVKYYPINQAQPSGAKKLESAAEGNNKYNVQLNDGQYVTVYEVVGGVVTKFNSTKPSVK